MRPLIPTSLVPIHSPSFELWLEGIRSCSESAIPGRSFGEGRISRPIDLGVRGFQKPGVFEEPARASAFLRIVRDRPHDDALLEVYADFLQESGDPRGQILQLEVRIRSGNANPNAIQLHARSQIARAQDGNENGFSSDKRLRIATLSYFFAELRSRFPLLVERLEGWILLIADECFRRWESRGRPLQTVVVPSPEASGRFVLLPPEDLITDGIFWFLDRIHQNSRDAELARLYWERLKIEDPGPPRVRGIEDLPPKVLEEATLVWKRRYFSPES